jgi:hypothetical protein
MMILWQGKSRFNPTQNISVVAITKTDNVKTGDMIQTFIIPEAEFVKREDEANRQIVCGDCPFLKAHACYVNLAFPVLAVWNKLRTKGYPKLDLNTFKDRAVRMGSYGEPVLIPFQLFVKVVNTARMWTGYTHAWQNKWAQRYRKYLMASVHTVADKDTANKMGWRTFRVIKSLDQQLPDEVICPASKEYHEKAGKKMACAECKLCCGTSSRSPKNVCIVAHGSRAVFHNLMRLLDQAA